MQKRAVERGVRVLAGDIGGTKTRVALFMVCGAHPKLEYEGVYRSQDHASLEDILGYFGRDCEVQADVACFGLAGPVRDGRCETTNLPWVVEAAVLKSRFGFRRVDLLNDLEANAWGIRALEAEDFRVLSAGTGQASGNASVISAGTGLGEAGLYWDGREHWPFASEGGHADFSPASELQCELMRFLSRRYAHVSWERVVSGPGLVDIHGFLLEYRGAVAPPWLSEVMAKGNPAAAISTAAMDHKDELCVEALELFVHLYGVEAGNHALKIMSTGGVYLGGGIAPKIIEWLVGRTFLDAFWSKGRMEPLLRDMPVRVILNERTALYGPAMYAAHAGSEGGRR